MTYILIIVAIVLGERKIKNYIEDNKVLGKEESIANGKIFITKYHNKGAALNFLADYSKYLMILICSIIGVLIVIFGKLLGRKGNVITKLGLSFIIGGALSNLLDRFEKGYVIDYIRFNFLKGLKRVIFNIADICIIIGSIIVFLSGWLKKE